MSGTFLSLAGFQVIIIGRFWVITEDSEIVYKRYIAKRAWFMLSQTSGQEYQPPAIPQWDKARALRTLNIEELPFEHLNGSVQA